VTTAQEVLDRLDARYRDEQAPPCPVCGRNLGVVAMGGGKATKWACDDRPKIAGEMHEWWNHYEKSAWTQYRSGDPDVLAAVAALRALLNIHKPTLGPSPAPDNVCAYDTTVEHPCPTHRVINHHLETT
jgi:hypothetical protein